MAKHSQGWGTRWETPAEILEKERRRSYATAGNATTYLCSVCGQPKTGFGGTVKWSGGSPGKGKRSFICRACRENGSQ